MAEQQIQNVNQNNSALNNPLTGDTTLNQNNMTGNAKIEENLGQHYTDKTSIENAMPDNDWRGDHHHLDMGLFQHNMANNPGADYGFTPYQNQLFDVDDFEVELSNAIKAAELEINRLNNRTYEQMFKAYAVAIVKVVNDIKIDGAEPLISTKGSGEVYISWRMT